MEAAGLVFAVANLIDPLLRLSHHSAASWQRSSNFGVDAERLRVRFKRERRQVEAIRQLLLLKAEGLGVDTTIFEQFEEQWQVDLIDDLRQLRALTQELQEIENRYAIFATVQTTATSLARPPTEQVVDQAFAENREAELQKAATASQLVRWGFKDAKRTSRILDELHKWVQLFKEDVEMCLWTCFKTPDRLQVLHQNAEIAALGLADAVELRRILKATVNPMAKNLEIRTPILIESQLGQNLWRARYQDCLALVERKQYDPNADVAILERTTHRVCQLAALLSRPQKPEAGPSLRVLTCAGYCVEPTGSHYSFVYKIPANLVPEPLSLHSALEAGEQKFRSTVSHRMQLAYTLSLSIYQLHLVGWVHKSFRSENIVLFPHIPEPTNNTLSTTQASVVPDALLDRRTKKQYSEPWLLGFEYSRVISQDSDLASTDTSIEKNIYRHPARWNAPTHRFDAIHDIYALGTVLLEIGLWRPLLSLSDSGFARAAEAASTADPAAANSMKESVRVQLLQYATKRLPFTLGRMYCDVVELCLSGVHRGTMGHEGFNVDENDHNALLKSFREKVVDRLARAVSST